MPRSPSADQADTAAGAARRYRDRNDPDGERERERDDLDALLDLAESALEVALQGGTPRPPDLGALQPALRRRGGVFVTLHVAGELNGCIGSIEAAEPIGHAAPRLALSAAFEDPRLPPLRPDDLAELSLEVSLLTPMTPLHVADRRELEAAVEPGVDGLLIRSRRRRGVLLPTVWAHLPDPADFLDALWQKAGLGRQSWPRDLDVFRFTTRVRGRPFGTTDHLRRPMHGPQ